MVDDTDRRGLAARRRPRRGPLCRASAACRHV